jgi:hypothetical protein
MTDAIVIEAAAMAGFRSYFANRRPWPTIWTPESQTWRECAARVLNRNLTSPEAIYSWWIEIREAKGWNVLSREQRNAWLRVYMAMHEAPNNPLMIQRAREYQAALDAAAAQERAQVAA